MANKPTLFDDVAERNVTFLLDTSGSMYSRLPIVKEHLKEYLQKLAFRGGCKFNMVEFSTTVTQWSDQMVQCLPETVTVASDWINALEAKTGTNTESALLAAYNDDECEAVYLVTDGLPDSKPSNILDRVAYVCRGRPCHCIYLTGASVDKEANNFLQDLATDTYGSFMIVTVTNHGSIERITPVYKASHSGTGVIRTVNKQIYAGTQRQCSVTSTLDHPPAVTTVLNGNTLLTTPYPYGLPAYPPTGPAVTAVPPYTMVQGPHPGVAYPHPLAVVPGPRVYSDESGRVLKVPYFNQAWAQWYQPYLWARYRTARSWLNLTDDLDGALSSMHISPAAGALLIDKPVLARRTSDGLYYNGRVKSQISDDRFLVEFAPCEKGEFSETTYQETFVFDIVQCDDGRRHSIMKGDKVLAPTEIGSELYAPGTVIDGQEGRETSKDIENRQLVVMFATGKSADIQTGKAIWIDQLLYDRTSFELKLPRKTRQQIVDTVTKYPEESLPGYPVSGADRDPAAWELPRKYHLGGQDATFQPHTGLQIHREGYEDYRPYMKDQSERSSTTREEIERHIPGTHYTQSELDKKVEEQIDAHRHDLQAHDISEKRKRDIERRKEMIRRQSREADSKEEIDKDISILEAELKYKMTLREKAIERKKHEIDDEIQLKVRERDQLMEDRRLLFGYPSETRLSRDRERAQLRSESMERDRAWDRERSRSVERSRSRSRNRSISPPSYRAMSPTAERARSRSRQSGYLHRSRSRSLSTERAPSFGHISPRSPRSRARSLSPSRSVSFDERRNSHHKYRYYEDPDYYYDSGFGGSDASGLRDSCTNTPIIRNGREIKLKARKDEKPMWKYWNTSQAKDIIDPPYHEPYSESAVAEPLELRDAQLRAGVVEWGGSHFNKVVPNGRTNYCERFVKTAPPAAMKSVSFQGNSNVHVASGSNLVTHVSRGEKKLKMRQNESQSRIQNMTPQTYYRGGDTVGPSMQDFHRERVAAQIARDKARPGNSYTRQFEAKLAAAQTAPTNRNVRVPNQSNNSSYQKEVNATSYKREVESRNQAMGNMSRDQQRITAMTARRQERDMLHAAKLQQQNNNQKRNVEVKTGRAMDRDIRVTNRLMAEVAKDNGRGGLMAAV